MTEDKPLCRGVRCLGGEVYLPPFAPRMVPLPLRREARGGGKAATRNCAGACLASALSLKQSNLLHGDFASADAKRELSARPRHPFGPHLISLYHT